MMSLAKGTTSTSFSTKYRLRMYVDESYNPQGDGGNLAFSIKINAYGRTGDKMKVTTGPVADVLLSGVGDNGTIDTTDPEQTFIMELILITTSGIVESYGEQYQLIPLIAL